jgi:hypothetical protein
MVGYMIRPGQPQGRVTKTSSTANLGAMFRDQRRRAVALTHYFRLVIRNVRDDLKVPCLVLSETSKMVFNLP